MPDIMATIRELFPQQAEAVERELAMQEALAVAERVVADAKSPVHEEPES